MSNSKSEKPQPKNLVALIDWFKKQIPTFVVKPTVATPPPVPKIGVLDGLQKLRSLNIRKLLPALISVPVVVFFAISGFIAWIVVMLKFLASLVGRMFRR